MKHISTNSIAVSQLSHFGLNPNQWRLSKKTSRIYRIQNVKAKSLVLEGHWDLNRWKSIWLISI